MMKFDFTDEAKAQVSRLPRLKSWVGANLNVMRAGQPEHRPTAGKTVVGKNSGKPGATKETVMDLMRWADNDFG